MAAVWPSSSSAWSKRGYSPASEARRFTGPNGVRPTFDNRVGEDVDNVTQLIKVADSKILFTGFVDDKVAVAAFDRGVFPKLPAMVAEFRSYLEAHDVAVIALDM